MTDDSTGTPLSRRAFLGTAALGTAVVGGAAAGGIRLGSAGRADSADADEARPAPSRGFRGNHQIGVLEHPRPHGLLAAFTCVDTDRTALRETFRELSEEVDGLLSGRAPADTDRALPPSDNGVLEEVTDPGLMATVSVGASLFDRRYGLADRKPRELVTMPFLANDRLDPANPDAGDEALMNTLVWTQPADAAVTATNREPAWTVGGTYQVVRVIRMMVERWDRASLDEQEEIFGRRKVTGAPLSGKAETDIPEYANDPAGEVIPLTAHIRLANPRDGRTKDKVLVRRGMSYSRGVDSAGLLDQGLAFVSYQRRLSHFLEAQERLKGEPLEEYLRPEGGGFFFVLPGVVEIGDFLGRALFDAR